MKVTIKDNNKKFEREVKFIKVGNNTIATVRYNKENYAIKPINTTEFKLGKKIGGV